MIRLALLTALIAGGNPSGPCDDERSSCKETCIMQHGASVDDEAPAKTAACIQVCTKEWESCQKRASSARKRRSELGKKTAPETAEPQGKFGVSVKVTDPSAPAASDAGTADSH